MTSRGEFESETGMSKDNGLRGLMVIGRAIHQRNGEESHLPSLLVSPI